MKWTQARWEKLNEAFGEGWEKECFPYLETGGLFQPGHQINRDEAQWDAILEAVKLFKRTHGRFPRSSGGDAHETRLYKWLQANMDTTSTYYTQERAYKLVLAFGDRWQSECFPKSEATYFEAGVLLGTRGSLNFFPVDSSVLPP